MVCLYNGMSNLDTRPSKCPRQPTLSVRSIVEERAEIAASSLHLESWSRQNSIICWTLSGGNRPLFTNYWLSKLTPLSLTKSLNYEVAAGSVYTRLWTCQVTDGRQPYSVCVSLYLPSSFLHSLTRDLDGFWNWCRCALMVHVQGVPEKTLL